MFKPTPAERRAEDRQAYNAERRRIRERSEATLIALGRYVGAMNAAFAIGSAGFISQIASNTPTPGVLKTIFAIGMTGVVFGGVTLLGTTLLAQEVQMAFKGHWRQVLHGRIRRFTKIPAERKHDLKTFVEKARHYYQEGRKNERSIADIVTGGMPQYFTVIMFLAYGIYLSATCALINAFLSVLAIWHS